MPEFSCQLVPKISILSKGLYSVYAYTSVYYSILLCIHVLRCVVSSNLFIVVSCFEYYSQLCSQCISQYIVVSCFEYYSQLCSQCISQCIVVS